MLTAAGNVRVCAVLATVICNTIDASTPEAGKFVNPSVTEPDVVSVAYDPTVQSRVTVPDVVPNGLTDPETWADSKLYNRLPFMSLSKLPPVNAAFKTALFCRSVISSAAY